MFTLRVTRRLLFIYIYIYVYIYIYIRFLQGLAVRVAVRANPGSICRGVRKISAAKRLYA